MSKNKTEVKVRLVITDFQCHPEEITRILGLQSSTTWMRGDPIPKTSMTRKQNGWRLDSPKPHEVLQKQIDALLVLVMGRVEAFERLPIGSEIELSCVIYVYDEDPALHFSDTSIRSLARLHASIDIDYYDLRETKKSTKS